MITLTKPVQVSSTLGDEASQVPYDRVVLGPINIDTIAQRIEANIRLTSSGNPEQSEIIGTLNIFAQENKLLIEVGSLARKQMSLNAAQVNAARKVITDTQNALESGLIALDVVKGVQAPS